MVEYAENYKCNRSHHSYYRCDQLGLIGFFNFNLVSYLFGSASMLSKVIYALVGICGLYLIGFYGPVTQEK